MMKEYILTMMKKCFFRPTTSPRIERLDLGHICNLSTDSIMKAAEVSAPGSNSPLPYARYQRNLTLLEIMIVIVLIGLIGSVIGFNMKGSLDEGKAFKTRQAQEQIRDILMLEVARGISLDEAVQQRQVILANSGLVKNPKTFLKDGWGEEFEVRVGGRAHDTIVVRSPKLAAYERKKSEKLGKVVEPVTDQDED